MEKAKILPKFLVAGVVAVALSLLALTGCSSGSQEDKTITVAAVPTPHAEILENAVAPILEEEGYTLEVKEFTDYVQPNTVTEEEEVDANYFQHGPYLENFNEENGTHLVSVTAVHYEPFGLYSTKYTSLDEIPNGSTVAVPNDATNEARALLLLQDQGLITLSDDAGITATTKDIVSNPKNLQFKEVEAATVPTIIDDVALAGINANYALEGDLIDKQLAKEASDSLAAQTYANLLVVKEGNEDSDKIQALADALNSDAVRDYINENYDGAVLPVF
jgi:D-methionine transport system substrate-binding protein